MILTFSLLYNKIDSFFSLPPYLTVRVFHLTRFGPVDALMFFDLYHTAVAQRKSAQMVISTESAQERNLSAVYLFTSHRCFQALQQLYTPLAQRQERQAHNLEDA